MSAERDESESHETAAIVVDFLDERTRLAPGDELTFGRRADLVIDENPFLHRVIGRIVRRESIWWLQNHGARTVIELRDTDSDFMSKIPPGHQSPITGRHMTVSFSAGPSNYELALQQDRRIEAAIDEGDSGGTATIDFGVVPLTTDQHLLLVALCEHRLLGESILPPNRSIARTIGWTITKFNRKLDAVCAKLSRQGVPGLRGSNDALASDRRVNLIDHAISAGLVTRGDLGLLHGLRDVPHTTQD